MGKAKRKMHKVDVSIPLDVGRHNKAEVNVDANDGAGVIGLEIPWRAADATAHRAGHVNFNLSHSQKRALKYVWCALNGDREMCEMPQRSLRSVEDNADAIRWMLDRIAEQLPPED